MTSYLRILLTGNQFDKHTFSAMSAVSNSRGLFELRLDTLESNFPGGGFLDPLKFNLTILDFSSPQGFGALNGSWSNATYFGTNLQIIDLAGNRGLGYASGATFAVS